MNIERNARNELPNKFKSFSGLYSYLESAPLLDIQCAAFMHSYIVTVGNEQNNILFELDFMHNNIAACTRSYDSKNYDITDTMPRYKVTVAGKDKLLSLLNLHI